MDVSSDATGLPGRGLKRQERGFCSAPSLDMLTRGSLLPCSEKVQATWEGHVEASPQTAHQPPDV